MAKQMAIKVFETKLVVQGTGGFPIDMLRYDSCFPWSESDSHALLNEGSLRLRTVTLRRRSVNTLSATEGRWKSFGWTIVSEESVQ